MNGFFSLVMRLRIKRYPGEDAGFLGTGLAQEGREALAAVNPDTTKSVVESLLGFPLGNEYKWVCVQRSVTIDIKVGAVSV